MPTRSIVRPLAAGLTLLAALSCGDPTAPLNTSGTYALVRIAGDALPAQAFENEFVRVASIADTLRFNSDGTGSTVTVDELVLLNPTRAPEVVRFEAAFHYVVAGARVEISFDCGPLASCVAPPHMVGRLTDTGIRFDFVLQSRVPQDYASVGLSP
jgi:hypothetical protein